jgi:hypothetical protein
MRLHFSVHSACVMGDSSQLKRGLERLLHTGQNACQTHAEYTNSSRALTDNRMNSVTQLYSIDLGTFRVALLICYPQRCWNLVIVILSECCEASPWPRPTAIPDVYPCPTLRNVEN